MNRLEEIAHDQQSTVDAVSFAVIKNICFPLHTDIDNGEGVDPKTFLSRFGEDESECRALLTDIDLDQYENRLIRNMQASGREVSPDYGRAVYRTLRTIQKHVKSEVSS